jgi:hypothetical protein
MDPFTLRDKSPLDLSIFYFYKDYVETKFLGAIKTIGRISSYNLSVGVIHFNAFVYI